MDIVFASIESVLEKLIACRKKPAIDVPELLLEFPHLKGLHVRLDQCIDGAILTLRTRHLKYSAGVGNAVMGASMRRATALKTKIDRW